MAEFVADAIRSVLNQTHPVDEILVLNDGSTDNLTEVLSQFEGQIKYLAFDENRGQMEAQNQMLARAEGDFFVPLSADDILEPTYVEKCLKAFSENPFTEFVSTQADFIDKEGKPQPPNSHPFQSIEKASNKTQDQWKNRLYYGNVYFGAGMYRTYAAREVGGWRKDLGAINDYEIYLKLLQRENIFIVEEPLTHYRITGRNQSILSPEEGKKLKQYYHDAKKAFYRPRIKLIIATPFYELKGFSPYISSMVQTAKILTQLGMEFEFWELSGDSYVHRARNTICARFLEDPDATDLFFIDSDMQWNTEALINMVMLPEAIVAGSYPTKNNWGSWTSIPHFEEGEDGKKHPRGRVLPDGTALLLAFVVAGGFLRIKRKALLDYQNHYKDFRYKEPAADPAAPDRIYTEFFATQRDGEFLYGEDMLFSKRLREMGMEMWIYPNVNMGHFGIKGWVGNYHEHLKGNMKAQEPFIENVNHRTLQ
jgi:glycosyltransferase involved in cell wall biosynthesis